MRRLICADDSKDMRAAQIGFIRIVFQQRGISAYIEEAEDGEELVRRVREGGYDLVFTDNSMPRMGGIKAIREIRKADGGVPIYMIAFGDEYGYTEKAALEAGATGYIDTADLDYPEKMEKALVRHLSDG